MGGVQTVTEFPGFVRSAKAAGMTDAEREDLIDFLAVNPEAGDLIVGSGGCRKVRWAGKGRGKSGGFRAVTVFVSPRGVFLIAVLAKTDAANFSDAEVAAMAASARRIRAGAE